MYTLTTQMKLSYNHRHPNQKRCLQLKLNAAMVMILSNDAKQMEFWGSVDQTWWAYNTASFQEAIMNKEKGGKEGRRDGEGGRKGG